MSRHSSAQRGKSGVPRVLRRHVSSIAFVSLVLAVSTTTAGIDGARYPWTRMLEPTDGARGTIGRFELDESLFDHALDGFSGLRVVNAATGAEAPYLVRPIHDRREIISEHDIQGRIIGFEKQPENRFRVVFERSPAAVHPPAGVLVLESRQRDFEKLVTVASSDDRSNWTILAENAAIYDYSKYLDLRCERVEIPADRSRYYRIDVSNIVQEQRSPLVQIARETRDGRLFSRIEQTHLRREDFRIDRVGLLEQRRRWSDTGTKLRAYTAEGLEVRQDEAHKTTVVSFKAYNVPLREVCFEIANLYFCRTCVLEANARAEGETGWVRLATATLQRVPGGHPVHGRTITLPTARRYRRYRATIENLDSPPLEVRSVALSGEAYECVFLGQPPGATCRVLYGNEDIAAPRYDIAGMLRSVEDESMIRYRLGPEEANPDFRRRGFAWLRSGRSLMVPAIILMVGVLVWLIALSTKLVGRTE